MTDQTYSTAGTNLVAIDVAKEWNVVLVQEASGHKRNFKVANNAADHDQLLLYLASLTKAPELINSHIVHDDE